MSDSGEVDMSRVPVLAILGSTGCGKSRLAIELARRFSGEIISADSMQVYKGLDIITAKVTKEEQAMAPHHMLDIVDPLIPNFTVVQFRDLAIPIIDDLLARSKLPIVVGGTNYYIESILWQILIDKSERDMSEEEKTDVSSSKRIKVEMDRSTSISNEELYSRLTEVDPEMAKRIHPNNRRKIIRLDGLVGELYETRHGKSRCGLEIAGYEMKDWITNLGCEFGQIGLLRTIRVCVQQLKRRGMLNLLELAGHLPQGGLGKRSLEVFDQHGVKHSELLRAQRNAGGSGLGGPLRHKNSVLLWLRCDKKVLEERLDRRVDAMLETGLMQELLDFHRRYNEQRIKSNTSADYTTGIFQSIGFKEFHAYLVQPEEERRGKKGEELLKKGIDDLKLVTKRYAKKQEKWVMNRFIRRSDRQVPSIYALDCTDLDQWNSNVYEPAVAIIEAVLRGEKPASKPLNESVEDLKFTDSSNEERRFCEACGRIFIGEHQWNIHLRSIKHKKVVQKNKKLAGE